jgi:hypothetical protein
MNYNCLHVPLDIGTWQCDLVPANDFYHGWSDRERWDPFANWDERKKQERQIEDDQCTFDQHFRPNYDLRSITGGAALREIQSFLSDLLNIAHWNLPTDNASIERILRQGVKDGKLVPIIDRDRRVTARTFRPVPAPLRWPSSGSSGGGMARSAYLFPPGTTSFNGEPVLSGPYNPTTQAAQLAALRAESGNDGSSDWLGVAESVAGAVPGDDAASTDDGGDQLADASDDTLTPFGNAQPFDYSEDMPDGDAEELAASTNNPGYAARMLGYDQKTFGDMIHVMKPANGLGPADNVIWHDNGDVSYNGKVIDNMGNYE